MKDELLQLYVCDIPNPALHTLQPFTFKLPEPPKLETPQMHTRKQTPNPKSINF